MELFIHITAFIGIILGLGITHLLSGSAKLIQHPERYKVYWVHMLWVIYLFLLMTHFWWWEFQLINIKKWLFSEYFFVICYAISFYLLCALLFPEDLKEYEGFEGYFYSRRKWFFGLLAICFVLDFEDTLIKGDHYYLLTTWEYPVRNTVHILLCVLAIKVTNKTFHSWLVIFFILFEVLFISRLFFALME